MTKQLIPVFTGAIAGQPVQLCDARNLRLFLEVQIRFNDWIARRIKEYGFVKGQDYIEFYSDLSKTKKGGRPRTDYHLTLDMAKELSMVERNEKGRQARRYFIECERELIAKFQESLQTTTVGIRFYLTPAERLLLRAYHECDSETPREELIDNVNVNVHWTLFKAIKLIQADESDEALRTLAALSAILPSSLGDKLTQRGDTSCCSPWLKQRRDSA